MAISIGTPATAAGTTSVALTLPAEATVGDLIVVDVFAEDSQASAGTTDWTPPAADDWTLIGQSGGSLSAHDFASFWRPVKVGDTPGSTSFTFTGTTSAPVVGGIDLIRDADPTAPFGGFAQVEQGTQENPGTHPGITTVSADQLVRVIVSSREGVTSVAATTPATQDERYDAGSGRRIAAYTFRQSAAGATGTLEYTFEAIHRYGIVAYYVNPTAEATAIELALAAATELDTANPLTLEPAGAAALALATATESDTAQPLALAPAGAATLALATATEIVTASPLALAGAGVTELALGSATETNTAQPLALIGAGTVELALTTAVELDIASALVLSPAGAATLTLGSTTEVDTASPLTLAPLSVTARLGVRLGLSRGGPRGSARRGGPTLRIRTRDG